MPGRPGLGAALGEALGLLVPVECAGCGRWDVVLCEQCVEALAAHRLMRCDDDAPMLVAAQLPTWSLGPYSGARRALVLGWKNHTRTDIAPAVLTAGRRAGRGWAAQLRGSVGGGEVVVVPAPSGRRRRLAGRFVVGELADAVAEGLAAGLAPARVTVVDLLRRRGGPRHQAGLGARGRAASRRGSIRALATVPAGAAVVLVDDVVTTGATLAECARVLGPGQVLGALVLASTPAPSRSARAR